ncbi:MAG: hypothetical protein K9L21_02725 [Spirochaetia bacterium]|nr:hypothetical protein [Spirochaetia bacterium]
MDAFREELIKRTQIPICNAVFPLAEVSPSLYILTEYELTCVSSDVIELPASIRCKFDMVKKLDKPGREGFRLVGSDSVDSSLVLIGRDQRGILYGLGHLLRKMSIFPDRIMLPEISGISETPEKSIRGHQLGYRPKSNTYDHWELTQFRQYIRELAFFGANAIEILPPRTDDVPRTKEMVSDPLFMMEELSREISNMGLDVWVWYPNLDSSVIKHPDALERELEERRIIFSRLPKIDHVMIPSGDPGSMAAADFFVWCSMIADLLHQYHPEAGVWISLQEFETADEKLRQFYLKVAENPEWLRGVVYGPWVKGPLEELRRIIPRQYQIRRYPDIGHTMVCQYPVPDWDPVFAATLGREVFNPRPRAYKVIHNRHADGSSGSITYSEGVNDDINKFVWMDQDWEKGRDIRETLEDYARFFIGSYADKDFTEGILRLESHWNGSAAEKAEEIGETLQFWERLADRLGPDILMNYRFVMPYLRACCDDYVAKRRIWELAAEMNVCSRLEDAAADSVSSTLDFAAAEIARGLMHPYQTRMRNIQFLSDRAYDLIRWQTTVTRHGGQNINRGAFVEGLNKPVSNLMFLKRNLFSGTGDETPEAYCQHMKKILRRMYPTVTGVFLRMDNIGSCSYCLSKSAVPEDPGGSRASFTAVTLNQFNQALQETESIPVFPIIEQTYLTSFFGSAIRISIPYLVNDRSYAITLCYVRDFRRSYGLRCTAGNNLIHDYVTLEQQTGIYEFSIPPGCLNSAGELELCWETKDQPVYGEGIAWLELHEITDDAGKNITSGAE